VVTYQHAQQLDALGDPTRRAILESLLKGPQPVGELARGLPVSRPAVSQHLRILKHAHLVIDRPEGNRRLYALNPAGVEALRAYFDRFWDQAGK
jgi:DNA-binding transcriptional ArsR family regulator